MKRFYSFCKTYAPELVCLILIIGICSFGCHSASAADTDLLPPEPPASHIL